MAERPLAADGEGGALLFVGSWGSPSQLLGLQQASDGGWRACTLAPPFGDSLAPIHDAVRFEEPAGKCLLSSLSISILGRKCPAITALQMRVK